MWSCPRLQTSMRLPGAEWAGGGICPAPKILKIVGNDLKPGVVIVF